VRRCLLGVAFVAWCLVPAGAAGAFPGGPWSRPVDGPVVRGYEPPATRFGPGHLGVDFGVPPGTPVRAAGDGVVVFAGRVGAGLHVVVLHAGDVRTTDSFLASMTVVRGEHVARGAIVGTSGGTGPQHAADVLHFGVRVGDEYVDPMLLFAPLDLGAIVHLAEPHGGAFAVTAATAEATVLAAEIRVDARPPLRAPPWWDAAATGSPPPTDRTTARARPPSRPAASSDPAGGPPVGSLAAGAVLPAAGAFAWSRRRRRAYR
jgi:murein DD-endopeptidase MepM/ murein hydrolase activator NlpD